MGGSLAGTAISTSPDPTWVQNWLRGGLLLLNISKSEDITSSDTGGVPRKRFLSATGAPSSADSLPAAPQRPPTRSPDGAVSKSTRAGVGYLKNTRSPKTL